MVSGSRQATQIKPSRRHSTSKRGDRGGRDAPAAGDEIEAEGHEKEHQRGLHPADAHADGQGVKQVERHSCGRPRAPHPQTAQGGEEDPPRGQPEGRHEQRRQSGNAVRSEDRPQAGEEEGLQRRGGAQHVLAGIEDEADAAGEVAGVAKGDEGVFERVVGGQGEPQPDAGPHESKHQGQKPLPRATTASGFLQVWGTSGPASLALVLHTKQIRRGEGERLCSARPRGASGPSLTGVGEARSIRAGRRRRLRESLLGEGAGVRLYRLNHLPDRDRGHIFSGLLFRRTYRRGGIAVRPSWFAGEPARRGARARQEEVLVVLQGRATVHFADADKTLGPGDVLVVEACERHHIESDPEDPCVLLYVHGEEEPHPNQRE